MSKKKNTLKDLDEFLKQQAATLVSPEKLKATNDTVPLLQGSPVMDNFSASISTDKILHDLRMLSTQEGNAFHGKLYDLIIGSLESRPQLGPEDKMLINTALYLKSGSGWKEVIRDYWRKQKG
jgi:hypothetical protein